MQEFYKHIRETTSKKFVNIETRDVNNSIIFKKDSFEVPEFWTDLSASIAASKYATESENSIFEVIERIVKTVQSWVPSAEHSFLQNLYIEILEQKIAPNTPVWLNLGVEKKRPQTAACFLGDVEDDLDDILDHSRRAGLIYKSGSGVGVNISKLRGKGEPLSNGGSSSGPISFVKTWDATAGSVKSGGASRRAAGLLCMDADHPDIEEFINCKSLEEEKIKALISAGFSAEEAVGSVFFQNANHSISVSNAFMQAVVDDANWSLINRVGKSTAKVVKAKELLRKIAESAWKSGDPGIIFSDTVNEMNPVPSFGKILSSNPCGELYSVPWSCCELCAVNVLKHLTKNGTIDFAGLEQSVRLSVRLLDYLLDRSYYPDERYRKRTLEIRPIGIGVANLGALLVAMGESYSSERGRLIAEDLYEHITKFAYLESIALAKEFGPYPALKENKEQALKIADKLLKPDSFYDKDVIIKAISDGFLRNSQLTTAQPTGTTGIVLGAETGGIEPYFALFTRKRLVGGGVLDLPSKTVSDALSKKLGKEVTPENLKEALETLSLTDQEVFKTAHEISWEDHIKMVAALQKRISSGLSKTANMPNNATVEDIEKAYILAWQLGLKGVTVYRDGSKNLQPIVNSKKIAVEEKVVKPDFVSYRKKLPKTRKSVTHTLEVGGFECYITVGLHEDGSPGEVFIRASKEGSMVNGLLDSFAICISYCLQYGVPLQKLVDKLSDTRFEPNGWTTDSDVPVCSSVVDYLARWMKKQFLDKEDQDVFEILEKTTKVVEKAVEKGIEKNEYGGPPCPNCGNITQRSGTCFVCSNCGTNVGGCTS